MYCNTWLRSALRWSTAKTWLATFCPIFLIAEALDFFGLFQQEQHSHTTLLLAVILSLVAPAYVSFPTKKTSLKIPYLDLKIDLRIGDIFDSQGSIVVSSNTVFEADLSAGKISPHSLQGQFTSNFYLNDQQGLISELKKGLDKLECGSPYPIGTVVPINVQGKVFYFLAMAHLNAEGNASTSLKMVRESFEGLWNYLRNAGELDDLAIPLIGTARGRLKTPRQRIAGIIAESFLDAAQSGRLAKRIEIVIRASDAKEYAINLKVLKQQLKSSLSI